MAGRKGAPECPICLESLDPPKRIFQCSEGHFLCESCRRNPAIKWCPTCRGPIVGRNIGMEQVLQEFVGMPDNLQQNPRACISLPDRDSHVVQMRALDVERAKFIRRLGSSQRGRGTSRGRGIHFDTLSIETQLLKNIILGRGMMTPSQRVLRRPGEVRASEGRGTMTPSQRMSRRSAEMVELRAINASEDESSSTTSYSDNDLNANIARGRGLRILKGVKKPGGLIDKEN